MSLKSGLNYEVKFALDTLVIYSAELGLKFTECIELLDTLIDFMFTCIDLQFGHIKPQKMYTYRELYEIETMTLQGLQANCGGTFDAKQQLTEKFCSAGLILRNSCLVPENLLFLCKSQRFHQLLFETINLPIPEEIDSFLLSTKDFLTTYPLFSSLEHRKNAIVTLSSIGAHVILPNQQTADTIVGICTDFISEEDIYYVYPAVDSLAKLLLNTQNHTLISQTNLTPLVQELLKILPQKGFTYETTPNQMALWELVMMIIHVLSTVLVGESLQKIIKLHGFTSTVLNLSKRPIAPPKYRPPPELLSQFMGIRERAFETYLTAMKSLEKNIQELLLTKMLFAQRDGDYFMVKLILESLSDDFEL
jgi:hypothetical protein